MDRVGIDKPAPVVPVLLRSVSRIAERVTKAKDWC